MGQNISCLKQCYMLCGAKLTNYLTPLRIVCDHGAGGEMCTLHRGSTVVLAAKVDLGKMVSMEMSTTHNYSTSVLFCARYRSNLDRLATILQTDRAIGT